MFPRVKHVTGSTSKRRQRPHNRRRAVLQGRVSLNEWDRASAPAPNFDITFL